MSRTVEEWEAYQASLEANRLAVEADREAKQAELDRMLAARKTARYDPKEQPRLNDLFRVSAVEHIAAQQEAKANIPSWVVNLPLPAQDPLVLAAKQRIINGEE